MTAIKFQTLAALAGLFLLCADFLAYSQADASLPAPVAMPVSSAAPSAPVSAADQCDSGAQAKGQFESACSAVSYWARSWEPQ